MCTQNYKPLIVEYNCFDLTKVGTINFWLKMDYSMLSSFQTVPVFGQIVSKAYFLCATN